MRRSVGSRLRRNVTLTDCSRETVGTDVSGITISILPAYSRNQLCRHNDPLTIIKAVLQFLIGGGSDLPTIAYEKKLGIS